MIRVHKWQVGPSSYYQISFCVNWTIDVATDFHSKSLKVESNPKSLIKIIRSLSERISRQVTNVQIPIFWADLKLEFLLNLIVWKMT